MNQNDTQGAGDTAHQDAAEADTLDDRSAQDRKVQIAEMLAREQDPEHQARVAKADLAFARRTKAEEDLSEYNCLRKEALKKGDLQNFEAAKAAVFNAENKLHDAKQNIKELRGDHHGDVTPPAMKPHQAATPSPAPMVVGSATPLQRGAAQDAAILAAIQNAGLDPQALPVNPPGKKGAKAAIRAALEGVSPLFQPKSRTFNKAWERLRERGEIANRP